MSKSKYSKTKAAGLLCGMVRHGDYKSREKSSGPAVNVRNRQMRRMQEKK